MNRLAPSGPVILSATIGILSIAACGGDITNGGGNGGNGDGDPSGTLSVEVSAEEKAGHAFHISVTGSQISNPQSGQADFEFFSSVEGNDLEVISVGRLESGTLLTFEVPDVDNATEYSAELVEVAGSDNALRPVGEYSVTIEAQ